MTVEVLKAEEPKLEVFTKIEQDEDFNVDLSPSTPSLSNPDSLGLVHNGSVPRKPTRKSTLTQQQKNQKRQRATQDQLNTLEMEFNKNPTPTAVVRERIAQDINMTERSVQIWFQNRRAKIKNLAKKSIETGEDCDAIPESMRKYLAIQALESGKPLIRGDILGPGAAAAYGNSLLMNNDSNASKIMIHHINCNSLSIGTWRRIGQTALDLVVFYSPAKAMVTYYINADSSGFRIEYPFSYIKNITLENSDSSANAEGASQQSGGLIVELSHPPNFSMDPGSGGWFQCRDFTEDQQASLVLTHRLGGHGKVLSGQLAKLVSLDSFRNRNSTLEPGTNNATSISAPVSPVGHRPSSRPNHLIHPHHQMYPETAFEMGPPPPRGHKRQRSRSVPVAIDFSQFRQPMAPIYIQQNLQQNQHFHMANAHSHIYAPVPQHAAPPQFASPPPSEYGTPVGPALNVDTSADYGLDFRPGPMSSTTATTPPSEFDSNFYSAGPSSETFSAPQLHTPFQGPFLSPFIDSSQTINPPVSPLSALSNGEPIIANQSPPLEQMNKNGASDFYTGAEHGTGFDENSFSFNELLGKQAFTLPFRSDIVEAPGEDFDFQNMVNWYGTADHSSLSPEHQDVSTTPNGNSQ